MSSKKDEKSEDKNEMSIAVKYIRIYTKISPLLKELEALARESGAKHLANNVQRMNDFLRANLRSEIGFSNREFDDEWH